MHLDVVFAADPRFPGGTSSATLMDMRAVRRMGLTAGLLPVRSAVLPTVRGMHPRLRAGMEAAGIVPLAPDSPVTCDLLLAEHPTLFLYMADRPTLVRPRAAVLIANHPPRIGRTTPEYDLVEVLDNMERLFGVDAHVAPISPIVRDLILETPVRRDRITGSDLTRILDVDDWAMPIRPPRAGEPVVIGRHGRPDPLKWPDTIEDVLAAYPVREDVRVHMLGGGPPAALMDHWPGSWRIQPFSVDHPKTFLEGIDFYVYFHSRAWIEAFGLSVLEAMAAGKVVIVSASFRPLFGDGALYATPGDVMEIVDRLRDDPAAYVEQATRARAIAAERFSYPTFEAQFREIRREIGAERSDETAPARPVARTPVADPPTAAAAVPASPLPTRRLMLVSSNGIGLGHITRLAAIARRLPGHVEPVFYTLSQGASLLRDLGFNADFVPSHQARGFTGESWNRAFAHDFAAALEYHAPEAVVFDGSMPYTGLVDVLDARPRLTSFWMRRALWKPGQSEIALVRDMHFTAVIEPGDIAEREDVGTTVLGRQDVLRVPPILLHDATERLSREDARRALDLPETGRIVCLQLGIFGDTDLAPLRAALVDRLIRRFGCTVVEIRSPLAAAPPGATPDGLLRRRFYPLSRHFTAFDLMITEAGYNSFHEATLSGTPAIFIPRDTPGVDDQSLRARYAVSAGLGFALERHETARLDPLLERALDPASAAEIARRAARLAMPNGAVEAARFIVETAMMLRADRPLGSAVNR